MVKNIKYILKKVIIGILISLAIMFLKTNVFAKSYTADVYGSVQFIEDNDTVITRNATDYTISYFPGITFTGWKTGASSGKFLMIKFKTDVSSIEKAGFYNIDFLFNSYWYGPLEDNFTFSIYYDNRYYVCNSNASNVPSSETTPAQTYKEVQGVKCENVYLDMYTPNNMWVYVFIHSEYNNGNTFGITNPTVSYLSSNASSEIANVAEETNETLKDDSVDNDKADSDISTMNNKLASNSTITQLLTMPIRLYQAILNDLNSSGCHSYNLGTMFGHYIVLPCVSTRLQNALGSNLYEIIDIICAGMLILSLRKKFVDIFNNMTSLKDRGNEVE